MKRSPLRSSSKTRSRNAVEESLDDLCREVVFARDRSRCQWCRGPSAYLQWCHIHTRRIKSMRWRLENSLVLCAGCHLKWHDHPLEGARWFEDAFPERIKKLAMMRHAKHTGQRTDLTATKLYLEQELERLT